MPAPAQPSPRRLAGPAVEPQHPASRPPGHIPSPREQRMSISYVRHITSMALGIFGASLVSGVKTGIAALFGGVFLGAGLGLGSMRRQGSRR
jgi:hypothetical protein